MIQTKVYTDTVQRSMTSLAAKIRNRRQINQAASMYLYRWVMQNFATEGGKVGGWKPLKPATIRARLRKSRASKSAKRLARSALRAGMGMNAIRREQKAARAVGAIGKSFSFKILQDTGNLRQSFAPFADVYKAGVGAQASFGVDYAEVHENGGRRVPKRRMLPTTDEVRPHMIRVYSTWLDGNAKEVGLQK